jgi:hypothetical protein
LWAGFDSRTMFDLCHKQSCIPTCEELKSRINYRTEAIFWHHDPSLPCPWVILEISMWPFWSTGAGA